MDRGSAQRTKGLRAIQVTTCSGVVIFPSLNFAPRQKAIEGLEGHLQFRGYVLIGTWLPDIAPIHIPPHQREVYLVSPS